MGWKWPPHRPDAPRPYGRSTWPFTIDWHLLLLVVVIVVVLLIACSTPGDIAVAAARRDFPSCRSIRETGRFHDEVTLDVCGVPVSYEVTPLETKRKR